MNIKYPHHDIAQWRDDGMSWDEIAGRHGWEVGKLRKSHSKWKTRRALDPDSITEPHVVQKWLRTDEGTVHVKYPPVAIDEENVKRIWDAFIADALEHAPRYDPPEPPPPVDEPMLAVPNLYDAHFGMRADARETGGEDQDTSLISDDWKRAVDHLVGMARLYSLDRWMVPLGHDLSHIDHMDGKIGVTRAGTQQDHDSRLWKIFTGVRQASVYLIDAMRSTGLPVDVWMTPGNHDTDQNFQLGEVLQAWYRHDEGITFNNEPKLRKFYGYGRNAWMLYHGEQYLKKKSGNPVTIFATECPADIWVGSEGGCREILSGHFHKRMKGRYTPTADMDEERGIVSRSLPGLTATDQWHYAKGYLHKRAATLLVYKKSGGCYALHEFNP